MDIIIRILIATLVISYVLGWILNILIIYSLRILGRSNEIAFPSVKRQFLYASVTGLILWVVGIILFLANVEMH